MDRDSFWQRNEHYQDNYATLHATPITYTKDAKNICLKYRITKNAKKIVIKDYEQKIKILHETGQIQKINNFEFVAICIFFAYIIIILLQCKIKFEIINFVYNLLCIRFYFHEHH